MVANSEVEPPELAGLPTVKAGTEQSCTEQGDDFGRGTEMRSNDDSGVKSNTQMWRIPDMKDNMRLNGNSSSTTTKINQNTTPSTSSSVEIDDKKAIAIQCDVM